ncbi:hypothetical protein F5984_25960 [Rudanella paleaurantiibacter]|uniref:Uncharacterized protein n=1 Tax=Rudanella paleaurantiibacter TaxID=2614655 RepID=A0A7J5TRX1_9BACT|nr:hypothetical protein [Rudanella paleaurantiibacter]KAB7725491.1 hypothetical protein F5984_25960 [Rudanella paleaurantiibacter]
MSIHVTPPPAKRAFPTEKILTNQLYIEFPPEWSTLSKRYTIYRYQLTEAQNNHRRFADRNFFARFTNAYKNQFDRPFYFYTYDAPYASLYSLIPNDQKPEPWFYPFGSTPQTQPEEIAYQTLAPDEVRPHVLLKLMMALCFYEASPNEQDRRVCQNKFYLRIKGKHKANWQTVVEFKPSVSNAGSGFQLTLSVETQRFSRVRTAEGKASESMAWGSTSTFYELFESRGHTYLRQLRPSQLASFSGDLYQQAPIKGRKAKSDWHNDGANYKESRSFAVRHVQERFRAFLTSYGFNVSLGEESLCRQPTQNSPLPVQRLGQIQVLDNRLNRSGVSTDVYLNWLNDYPFHTSDGLIPLQFRLVSLASLNENQPLLVLQDVDPTAFGLDENDKPRLLTEKGVQDPYQILYKQYPHVVKQSLNVNPNRGEDFAIAKDYLTYSFMAPSIQPMSEGFGEGELDEQQATRHRANLERNLEVCLSELWLKWVITGKVSCLSSMPCLPYMSQLVNAWGFISNNVLLFFEDGQIRFSDLETPAGKRVLQERFIPWSTIRNTFLTRIGKDEKRADVALINAHFILVDQQVLELEKTEVIAMPNWPRILDIKAQDPGKSARSREAIGVYAGGIWYSESPYQYVVSSMTSSAGREERGHHFYRIHVYNEDLPVPMATLLSLLAVSFVRKNQFTVWPYPFDLIRLHREVS